MLPSAGQQTIPVGLGVPSEDKAQEERRKVAGNGHPENDQIAENRKSPPKKHRKNKRQTAPRFNRIASAAPEPLTAFCKLVDISSTGTRGAGTRIKAGCRMAGHSQFREGSARFDP
jgi:hypothetical protein